MGAAAIGVGDAGGVIKLDGAAKVAVAVISNIPIISYSFYSFFNLQPLTAAHPT
jgi:hypothetical protein